MWPLSSLGTRLMCVTCEQRRKEASKLSVFFVEGFLLCKRRGREGKRKDEHRCCTKSEVVAASNSSSVQIAVTTITSFRKEHTH